MSTYGLDFPAPKGLHIIAQGKRSVTLGLNRKTKPVYYPEGVT
jgi:hypothetical protein